MEYFTNQEISKLLKEAAACYKIKGEASHRFQILAYERAAEIIEQLTSEVEDLWKEGQLSTIPGVGVAIGQHLEELFKTGSVKHIENLKKRLPKGMFSLLNIPGIGAKTAYRLALTFHLNDEITAIEKIKEIALNHQISSLEGFGDKSEQEILDNINRLEAKTTKKDRMSLPFASVVANKVIDHLKKLRSALRIEPLGSLRRQVSTIGDVDIAVASEKPSEIIDWFVKYPRTKRVLEKGEKTASIIVETGTQIDLMVQPPKRFGSLLQHFTGSKEHNIHLREYALSKNLSLSEYGIKQNGKLKEFKSEVDFYNDLGLEWIPPELRENYGEIEASIAKKLPKLVTLEEIKGDLQIHSDYNIEPSHDLGSSSMPEILKKAEELKYDYIGFSEHNPSITNHSKTQIIDIIKRRRDYIEQLKYSTKSVHIISLLEVDILPDGRLSVPDEALELLDGCMVSIHTVMNQPKEEMTKRVIEALKNPYARFLAHPTGRLIQKREGYDLDWEAVFDLAKKLGKAIEINAAPERLDLPDVLVKEAVKNQIKLIINTDSHSLEGLNMMQYGIYVARRGWAEKGDIINTLPYNQILDWFHKRT